MFKNRAIQMTMVKTPANDTTEATEEYHIDPEQISKIVQENVKYAAIAIGSVILLNRVLSTASQIAVTATTAHLY